MRQYKSPFHKMWRIESPRKSRSYTYILRISCKLFLFGEFVTLNSLNIVLDDCTFSPRDVTVGCTGLTLFISSSVRRNLRRRNWNNIYFNEAYNNRFTGDSLIDRLHVSNTRFPLTAVDCSQPVLPNAKTYTDQIHFWCSFRTLYPRGENGILL